MDLKQSVAPHIIIFKIIGRWPFGNKIFFKFYSHFLIINVFLYNLTQFIYVASKLNNFLEVSQIIHMLISTIAALLKAIILGRNNALIKHILSYMEMPQFQPQNNKEERILKKTASLCSIIFYVFGVNCIAVLVMFPIAPILEHNRRIPIEAWFPFDFLAPGYYPVTYVWQSVFFIYHGFLTVSVDTFFAAVLIHIAAQCDILNGRILKFGSGDDGQQSNDQKLIDLITIHKVIVSWALKFNEAFGSIVLVQFVTSTVALCETLFVVSLSKLSRITVLSILVYQFALFIQLLLYCWYGNEVRLKSEAFSYSLFSCNWLHLSTVTKMNLKFFMHRVQKPIEFYVGKIFPANLATFLVILRSAWAYFSTLRNMRSKQI